MKRQRPSSIPQPSSSSTKSTNIIAIGMSAGARVLFVVHVERGTRDRIISARCATAAEESIYPGGP